MASAQDTSTAPRGCNKQRPAGTRKIGCLINLACKGSITMLKGRPASGKVGKEPSKDAAWEQMFEELKAIKERTGTCNLPDKKGRLAKWVYTQRKAYRRIQITRGTATTRAHLAKLESIGFEFSSSSYVAWDLMFEKYKNRRQVDLSEDEARKLKMWIANQRLEYSRQRRGLPNNITQGRIEKLEAEGFEWVGKSGKPKSSSGESDGTNSSVYSKEEGTGEEGDATGRATKKRRRFEKDSCSPSKRTNIGAATREDRQGARASSSRGTSCKHVHSQSHRSGLLDDRDDQMQEVGSLLHVLAAMKHVNVTHLATEALKDGSNRRLVGTEDNDSNEATLQSDASVSGESGSLCDEKTSTAIGSRENIKLLPPTCRYCDNATVAVSGMKESGTQQTIPCLGPVSAPLVHAYHGVEPDRFYQNRNYSSHMAAAVFKNDDGTTNNNNQHGMKWPDPGSLHSASHGGPHIRSLVGESVLSTHAHSTQFVLPGQLPIATMPSTIHSNRQQLVHSYMLSSAADVSQAFPRQQQYIVGPPHSASFASNDCLPGLRTLGNGGGGSHLLFTTFLT